MAYTDIDDPSAYFQTTLYTGNGGTQSVTNGGNSDLQPDWLWIKDRDDTPSHVLHDIIRGVTKRIMSNNTNAEDTGSQINSFDTDGFTVPNNNNNTNGSDFVAWNWLGSNTTASNGNGSITSTVSLNATAGFSVVKWTGSGANATIGHGLGVTPSMLMVKNVTAVGGWRVWHQDLGTTESLQLNTTAAVSTSAGQFNSSATFNSTVFSVGGEGDTNQSSQTIISYSFAEKQGYSKFGSYTGNGNADGTFVYTGFKPAFIMVKRSNGTENWTIMDNTRDPFNVAGNKLHPNTTGGTDAGATIDILSNGFKNRTTNAGANGSGDSYIYMAIAENPFVTSTDNGSIPATAR